jgi:hypothetical protein
MSRGVGWSASDAIEWRIVRLCTRLERENRRLRALLRAGYSLPQAEAVLARLAIRHNDAAGA